MLSFGFREPSNVRLVAGRPLREADQLAKLGAVLRTVLLDSDNCNPSRAAALSGLDSQRLVAMVCSGYVGAVYCIEALRLAYNGRDWHRLDDLCAFAGALVIDPEGPYDPRLVTTACFSD